MRRMMASPKMIPPPADRNVIIRMADKLVALIEVAPSVDDARGAAFGSGQPQDRKEG